MLRHGTSDKRQVHGYHALRVYRAGCPVTCHLSLVTGFSLIELVIAMGILAVGVVAAIRVFPMGLRVSQRAQHSSLATLIAQRTIESLKLKAWNDLGEGEATATEGDFQVTTRIHTPHVEQVMDPTRLKAIDVTVQWMQEGRARALEFVTYVRRSAS